MSAARLRAFEDTVPRRILGKKWAQIIGSWKKLHYEFRNLYPSPDIIRMIKSRRMRWAGHLAPLGRRGIHTGFW
jgi:hypothetical protein